MSSTVDALRKRIDRMIEALPKPRSYELSPEWDVIRATLIQESIPYPDAAIAIDGVLVEIESLQQPEWHIVETMIGQALKPFAEARIAIAAALVTYEQN